MMDDIEPNFHHVYNPPMPPDTPLPAPYPNLTNSTQHARNNFQPGKRKRVLSRVVSNQEDTASLTRVLQKYWGHSGWRGPQLEICKAAMEGEDILFVAPTGSGKSVCFQVPAVTMEYGITLVISPLSALMKDQVSSLKRKGIKAAMLYEKSSQQEAAYIKKQLKMGHPELRLLYITPETSFTSKSEQELEIAYKQKQINRLIIDEAHVIEEWGLTFRAAYRDLGKFRQRFPLVPITALTASATEDVRSDILSTSGIKRELLFQRVEPCNRKNLFYEVRYQGGLQAYERIENSANFIRGYRPEAVRRNAKHGIRSETVSGSVYCRSRGTCEDVARGLSAKGIKALPFHAKLDDSTRNERLDLWKAGQVECIVATIAFGMGVDQAHVRYVVHYDMPKSFEGYYQETGRAGRDGHLSRCILYYSREDALHQRNLIQREADSAERLRQKQGGYDALLKEEANKARVRTLNSFKDSQHYAESASQCRHVAICRYFGERIDPSNPEIKAAYCNKTCDVCSNPSMVSRRSMVLNEDIDVASQAQRPGMLPPPSTLISERPASRVAEGSQPNAELSVDKTADEPTATLQTLRLSHDTEIPKSSMSNTSEQPPIPSLVESTTSCEHATGGDKRMLWHNEAEKDAEADFDMPSSPTPRSRSFARMPTDGNAPDGFSVDDFLDEQCDLEPANPEQSPVDSPEAAPAVRRPKGKGKSRRCETGSEDDEAVMDHCLDGSDNCAVQREPSVPRSIYRQKAYAPQQAGRSSTRTTSPVAAEVHRSARSDGTNWHPYETPQRSRVSGQSIASASTGRKSVWTGHPCLVNVSARKGATTVDLFEEGDAGYAIVDAPPADPEKRQRQEEAFKAVTPITGRGPYSYYTNTAAPMTGRKRKLSAASESGLGFRTPFKAPTVRGKGKDRVCVVSKEHRIAAIGVLKDALRKSVVEGPEADRSWGHWGEPASGRKAISRASAVELESVVVRDCATPEISVERTTEIAASIRILRSMQGAEIVTERQSSEYRDDAHGRWLVVLDEIVRGSVQ